MVFINSNKQGRVIMPDETMQLLKAFIEASGYEVSKICNPSYDGTLNSDVTYTVTKKKPKPRAQSKQEWYSDDFLDFWSIYPKGHGGNKKEAYRQYKARILEGFRIDADNKPVHEQIISGTRKYAGYIKATGQHVKHPATFLGPNKHYLNDFTIPDSVVKKNRVKQEWEKIPEKDCHLIAFIEKWGYKKCGPNETVFDTRNRLRSEIRARILAEDE